MAEYRLGCSKQVRKLIGYTSGVSHSFRKLIHRLNNSCCAGLVILSVVSPVALAVEWPQEISVDGGTIVVYQPQPETLTAKTLQARDESPSGRSNARCWYERALNSLLLSRVFSDSVSV